MKISGRTTDDSTFGLLPQSGLSYETHHVDVDARVSIDTYTLVHSQPANNYRPSLHLKGQILAIKPAGDGEQTTFAHQIEEVSYLQGLAPRFEALYDFTDEQLSELVKRGYFHPGFDVGADVIRSMQELELPIDKLTLHIVAPDAEENIPLVFADITRLNTLKLDVDNTGYDFVDVVPQQQVQGELDESLALGSQEVILNLSEPETTHFDPSTLAEPESEAVVEVESEDEQEADGLGEPVVETGVEATEASIEDLYAANLADITAHSLPAGVGETSASVDVDEVLKQTVDGLTADALGEDAVAQLPEESEVEVLKADAATLDVNSDANSIHEPYGESEMDEDAEAEEDESQFGS